MSLKPVERPAVPVPTQAQRLKIRDLLDNHFDDKAGAYLDNYSDEKIGAEVGIGHAAVTMIREAAYGPIRVDPELAALRAELKGLTQAIERGEKGLNDLKSLAAGISNRLQVIEQRRAAA
jgi:hypothetical protein